MKKTVKYIAWILGILIVVIGLFIGLFAISWNNSFGDCGMSAGPIYGDSVTVQSENLEIDQLIEIPSGKFGLMNLSDSLSPKLIKFDKRDNIIWAVEFGEDSLVGLPHQRLSEMKLVNDEYGIRLSFFNYSYGEPGRIYLTDDYELEFMCLSPM